MLELRLTRGQAKALRWAVVLSLRSLYKRIDLAIARDEASKVEEQYIELLGELQDQLDEYLED